MEEVIRFPVRSSGVAFSCERAPIPSTGLNGQAMLPIPKIRRDPTKGIAEWFYFPRAFLEHLAAEDTDELRVVRVDTSLMCPQLQYRDIFLVDRARSTVLEEEKLFAFRWKELLEVAYLSSPNETTLLIRPGEPEYVAFEVPRNEIKTLGECVWFGRAG